MRNMQRYRKRLEKHRMRRKAKKLLIKKQQMKFCMRGMGGRRQKEVVPNWMTALITQLIKREKNSNVDKDKERRHQAR